MSNNNPKLTIGFTLYKDLTAKYLPYFLPSLKEQTFDDFEIIAIDHGVESEDGENIKYIRENHPEIEIIKADKNYGFSHANNRVIKKAFEKRSDYFLTINPDMILEEDAISKMIDALESDSNLASVSPKVLRWDFKQNKKTNIIDTCGIAMKPGFRFYDLGQGKGDNENIYKKSIIGPSGACAMYRMRDLEKIKEKEQYFDENMFMYKEDCDLAYKLFLIGSSSKLVKDAVVYHDRTADGEGNRDITVALNRRSKSRQVKIWSFQGQQIIFMKYWHLQNIWSKINIIIYEIKMLVFALVFERYLLKELLTIWKKRANIKIYK